MLHRAPEQAELDDHINFLLREYTSAKKTKTNPERVKLINLIESFKNGKDKAYNHQATLGIFTYGLVKIGGGFNLFYGEKHKRHYRLFGSELGILLQNSLNITYSNPLDDQKALIYLTDLYHHILKYPRALDGSPVEDQNKNELAKEIGSVINSLLERLTKKRPTYDALVRNFSHISDKYKELGGVDIERDRYAQFMHILNGEFIDKFQSEVKEDKEWSIPYSVRYGAMLFMMEKIESEYRYLSPEGGMLSKGSQLYKACKPSLNINYNTKEISVELKRKYYIDFLSYVLRIISQPNELQKWENKNFKDAEKFFLELRNMLAERVVELIKGDKPGALSLSYLDFVTSTAASYGVTIALGKMASGLSLKGSALTYFNILKPEAVLLITLLTYTLKAAMTQRVVGAVNKIIINTVAQPVIITFDSLDKLGKFFVSLFTADINTKAMEVVDNPDFLKALTLLPSDIFSDGLKEKMKYVVGFEKVDPEQQPQDKVVVLKSNLLVPL